MFDLVVRGGEVVSCGRSAALDIAITGERIAAIFRRGAAVSAERELDATGMTITPGGIDTHTHVDWPYDGQRTVDGALGASQAALLGGTTTIVDFVPPGEPGYDLRAACQNRVDLLSASISVDFALHPILIDASPSTIDVLPEVIADGFTSFKMYTTYEGRRVDDGAAWQLMRVIAKHGGLPGFHAENHELLEATLREQESMGQLTPRDYPQSRPALAEAEAIQMVSLYARRLDVPVYIFHISGQEALGAVDVARQAGTTVFAETCTHYLVHDETVFARPDPWRFVISPPIRKSQDREALWSAVRDGRVTAVGSDHCAYGSTSKAASPDDHRHVPAGAPGIEARTPLLWSEGVNRRGLSPAEFVGASSERAALALGLETKGRIEVGADADLVIWDPKATWVGQDLTRSSDLTFSLYEDVHGQGRPKHVLLRGKHVVANGLLTADSGNGQFLRRRARRQ